MNDVLGRNIIIKIRHGGKIYTAEDSFLCLAKLTETGRINTAAIMA